VSLAWLEAQPAVTSVILGARNTEQLAENLGAASVVLTPDDLERLDEVSAPVVSDYPYGEPAADQRHRAIDASGCPAWRPPPTRAMADRRPLPLPGSTQS
jgi:hypothetical protein